MADPAFIQDVPTRDQYTAAAGQTIFDYTFPVFDEIDLVVQQVLLSNPTNPLTLILNVDYTVTGVGQQAGGTIILTVGTSVGDTIIIFREVVKKRITDFSNTAPFNSDNVNLELNRIVQMTQDRAREISQAIRIPDTDVNSPANDVPVEALRAGKVLGFDEITSQPVVGSSLSAIATLITQGLSSLTADPSAIVASFSVARAISSSGLVSGEIVRITNAGRGGDFVVTAGSVVDNDGTNLEFDDDPFPGNSLYLKRLNTTGMLYIDWFGASAGAVAAVNTPAIQAALDIGGAVFGVAGTYISNKIEIGNNTELFMPPGTGLKLANNQDDHLIVNKDPTGGNVNCNVTGGEYDGNKTNQTTFANSDCIRFENVKNGIIRNVHVHDSEFTGVELHRCNNVKIIDPLSEDCGTPNVLNSGDGLAIRTSVDCHIIRPTVRRASRIGILVKGTVTDICRDCTIMGPTIVEDTGEDAIHAEDFVQDIQIKHFLIKTTGLNTAGATKSGIAVGDAGTQNITISDGEIRDAGGFGIEIAGGLLNIKFKDIDIVNPVSDGIRVNISDGTGAGLGGMRGLKVIGVNVSGSGRDSFAIGRSATNGVDPVNLNEDVIFENCNSDNSNRVGYSFLSCPGIKIINCNTDGVGLVTIAEAIELFDCDDAIISGGELKGYPRTGIVSKASLLTTVARNVIKNVVFDGEDIAVRIEAVIDSKIVYNIIRKLAGAGSVGIQTQTTSTNNIIAFNDLDDATTPLSLAGTNKTHGNAGVDF